MIELIVTTGILVLVSTLILADYPEFSHALSLKRTSQEIALVIRQAQVYGLGVRKFSTGTGDIYPGYGAHFDVSNPDSLVLFADVNANNRYDGSSETVELFKIQTNSKIFQLCGDIKSAPPGNCSISTMDIIFLRPVPTVIFTANGGAASVSSDAEIGVISAKGKVSTIIVYSSGQISIE